MKRTLTAQETAEILNLKKQDINSKLMRDYFSVKLGKSTSRFNTFDVFSLPKDHLFNKEAIRTTVGRYIFNLYVIPEKYLRKYGFQNIVFDADSLKDIQSQLATMLLNDEISSYEYIYFLDHGEWLGMNTAYYLVPSLTSDFIRPLDSVKKKRDELFDKYKDEIKRGDTNTAVAIEKELMGMAIKELNEKKPPSYELYKSKEFNLGAAYRKTSVLGSVNEDLYTHDISVLKSNYADGIDMKEYSKFASLTILGGYSRGVKTQKYGYESKKYNNAMQATVLDDLNTDCGTHKLIKVSIHPKMKSMFLFRYIAEDPNHPENLTLITEKNISKYINKEIHMRSPMFCKGDRICNKCAGELYYKIGLKNVGLLASNLTGSLLNLSISKLVALQSNL